MSTFWGTDHGGEAGIRTLGRLSPATVFKTVPLDHSGTSPDLFIFIHFKKKSKLLLFFTKKSPIRRFLRLCGPDGARTRDLCRDRAAL